MLGKLLDSFYWWAQNQNCLRNWVMQKLSLNDPRWSDLDSRNGNAAWVPQQLAALLERPSDLAAFGNLWQELCSEGTAWSAAYAAVPYVAELAKRLAPEQRMEHIYFVGLVVMCSAPDSLALAKEASPITLQPYLVEGYRHALAEVMPLLAETLICPHDLSETKYLLAAAAALKGHAKLGAVLNHLECICGECPKCGTCIYPEELQEAAG
jgi:hypothetical protein